MEKVLKIANWGKVVHMVWLEIKDEFLVQLLLGHCDLVRRIVNYHGHI